MADALSRWSVRAGIAGFGLTAGVLGCTDVVTPTAHYALTHPWGTRTPVARGKSKAEILHKWGPPDLVVPRGTDELGLPKEEWIYRAKTTLPIDYRNLSKTKRIVFTGDHVTGWEDDAAEAGPTHH